MKKFPLLFLVILFVSCARNEFRYPEHLAISGLILPVYLQNDTAVFNLADYFQNPEKVKKITLSSGLSVEREKNRLRIFSDGEMVLPGNMRMKYEGYNYDIPVFMKPEEEGEESPVHILTDKLRGDTLFIRSLDSVLNWSVYWQNSRLGKQYLEVSDKGLKIIIPKAVKFLKKGEFRIWAANHTRLSNDIVLPLEKGKVLEHVRPEELLIRDTVLDHGIYDETITVFASPRESFKRLNRLLEKNLDTLGYHHMQVYIPGIEECGRFMSYATERLRQNRDTVCYRLLQLLAFHATIPGAPFLYFKSETEVNARNAPEKPDDIETFLKNSIQELERIRLSHMALIYGDFVPLRVEDQVYAYLRSYFGQNVIVVFNKGQDPISLKLDLPRMERNENFNSLFNSRFSYDNSRLILDVPANGVELIYSSTD